MLRHTDREYIETKKIKSGRLSLNKKFVPFANWIHSKYNIEILNIVTDYINEDTLRLQLIFEHQKDVERFRLKNQFTYSPLKERTIKKEYNNLFQDKIEDSILLLFYAFEPLAKEETMASIPVKIKNAFKEKYKDKLWGVSTFGEHVTFFFFTNDALKIAEHHKQTFRIKEEYYSLLKPFDKFNYFTLENFHAIYDSKENFDTKFESNWRWYYS